MASEKTTDDVIRRAEAVFESQDKAQEWLQSNVPALGNQKPNDLLETPMGKQLVVAALRKLESGDFS